MYAALLTIIYLSFISLGLPDSLLGAGWPVMHNEFGTSFAYAGIVSMIISIGTVTASLVCARLMRYLTTGSLTALSVLISALSLVGFAYSDAFWMLCVMAIPYGLSAGAVDAALNNYVAAHYTARHMNWLHASWGVGASLSPYIMGLALVGAGDWSQGYMTVFWLQLALCIILFATLPLWKKQKSISTEEESPETHRVLKLREALRIRGVKPILITFAAYCGLESTTGIWTASYLVDSRDLSPESAAYHAALFFLGITLGRFLCGFIANSLSHKVMIYGGISIMALGVGGMFFSLGATALIASFLLLGLGCAPIYPAIIHSTPLCFGRDVSLSLIGFQMGGAYVGSSFMPPIFGGLAGVFSLSAFPYFLLFLIVIMLLHYSRLKMKNPSHTL